MKKYCPNCKIEKEISEFNKNKTRKDGFQRLCKICGNLESKKYHHQFKEKRNLQNKLWKQNKIKENPNYNKERYLKDIENYKKRANLYRENPHNRLVQILGSARKRAKDKNLLFDLDIEFLENLWEKQKGCCLLTGIPFDLKSGERKDKTHFNPFAPCIDKIDVKEGYTKNNIRLICNHMNTALWDYGVNLFDTLIKNYLKTTKNIEINYE